ncbi:MAG: hypothetical protein NWE90_04590 [Candidatus Bathyarchaeota archaeon]|nr:hypothetical protein [Candidatus Bathyarchaeota archaeon]
MYVSFIDAVMSGNVGGDGKIFDDLYVSFRPNPHFNHLSPVRKE